MSWHAAMAAVRDHGQPRVDHLARLGAPAAIGSDETFPHARLVVGHFHVIRLANAALDEVRRRTQQASLGHRGRKADPLYRIRRRLLAGHERLHPAGFARVLARLDAGSLPQCHVTPTLRELAEAVEVAMAEDRAKRSFSMAIVLDHMLESAETNLRNRSHRTCASAAGTWDDPISLCESECGDC